MKRLFLLFILLSAIQVSAQELEVKSFAPKTNDLSASTNPRHDNNNIACALIKVQLAAQGAQFEGNVVGETDYKTSEYLVYMASGSKRVKVKLEGYLPLEVNFADYGIKLLESKVTYELRISIPEVGSQTPNVTSQYLVFKVSPADAVVKVNETIWPNNNGVARMLVPFGEYTYLIQSKNYHSASGKISVDDPANKKEVEISLKPNFGWIEVKGSGELLGASVYIDNNYIGKVPVKSEALKSGQYEVLIAKELYNSYSAIITVSDNQTSTVTPSLVANFSNITLKVDDDAEIWVNDEKKGIGNWTGNLESGSYKVECKKTNHETSTKYLEITNQMKGKTISLDAPKPICGSLIVESTPDYVEIYIDDKKMGETPIQINSILIGQHSLRLEKSGFVPIIKEIIIEKGKSLTLNEKLSMGCSVTIKSEYKGDQVYIDNRIVGTTPLTTILGFGKYTFRVMHDGSAQEKSIEISSNDHNKEIVFEYSRKIHITTDKAGAAIYVDNKKVGTSPLFVNMTDGKHHIHAKLDDEYADFNMNVKRTGGKNSVHLSLQEKERGDFFVAPIGFICRLGKEGKHIEPAFDCELGRVKNKGWFISFATNAHFSEDTLRFSLIGGTMFKIGGFDGIQSYYLHVGAGYGRSYHKNIEQNNIKVLRGVDVSAGIQIVSGRMLVTTFDVVTTNFQTFEFKFVWGLAIPSKPPKKQ